MTVPGSFSEGFPKTERSSNAYTFGPFRLDTAEGVLRRSGKPVELFPKAVELLTVLVAANGSVVRKETLLRTVWATTFVEENTLSKYVSFLRKALGHRRYIETVSRRGYRFTARVAELGTLASAPRPGVTSLAMMPLESAARPLDYLCEGLTERVIAGLSRLPGLKVMGASTVFRFRKRDLGPRQIARELQVDAVLCGSLSRKGHRLELAVELCDASGARLWGERYERSRSQLSVWDCDLVRDIATALRRRWTPQETPSAARTGISTEAYHLYLKGVYQYNKRTQAGLAKSAEYHRRALEVDPRFALAHVGLGSAYSALSWVWVGTMSPSDVRPIIEASASLALELDPALPEAHVLHGNLLVWHAWDWSEAERAFRRALELNAQCVSALQIFGFFLSALGRLEEAETLLAAARDVDPLSSVVGMNRAWVSYVGQRYDEAILRCEETLDVEPGFGPIRMVLALCYERKGLVVRALEEVERAMEQLDTNTSIACMHAYLLGSAGRRKKAIHVLREVEGLRGSRYVSSVDLAIGYAGIGETERVFDYLRRAWDERSFGLVLLNSLTVFDGVRSDPRFEDLVRRVGLTT